VTAVSMSRDGCGRHGDDDRRRDDGARRVRRRADHGAVVRFALRPLGRVVSTAAEVATLPLDRDNHQITPRVPQRDTDPRTEVGLVGDTLNRLLDNVERALGDVAASDRRMRRFITDASPNCAPHWPPSAATRS